MQRLLTSFHEMAQANKELAAAATAANNNRVAAAASNSGTTAGTSTPLVADVNTNAGAGAVALTGIKVPLDMGRDAEERLVNFHEWKEEVDDKLEVAGVTNERQKTTIALMWGGRDIKEFAVDKANVILRATTDVPEDGWSDAAKKIEKKAPKQPGGRRSAK